MNDKTIEIIGAIFRCKKCGKVFCEKWDYDMVDIDLNKDRCGDSNPITETFQSCPECEEECYIKTGEGTMRKKYECTQCSRKCISNLTEQDLIYMDEKDCPYHPVPHRMIWTCVDLGERHMITPKACRGDKYKEMIAITRREIDDILRDYWIPDVTNVLKINKYDLTYWKKLFWTDQYDIRDLLKKSGWEVDGTEYYDCEWLTITLPEAADDKD